MKRKLHQTPLCRLLWCAIGAACGILIALSVAGPPASPFLLASLGGSTVFLFGLTTFPAAQPRALLGGHLIAALVGIVCYQTLGDALWVVTLAQVLAMCLMFATRTIHPPAGANAILMVYTHASWSALYLPVLIGVLCLAGVTMIWSRLYPGQIRYPTAWMAPSPAQGLSWGGWVDEYDRQA